MMPTPFVLNDAVVIKQKIINEITRAPLPVSLKNQHLLKSVQFSKKVITRKPQV
jgi:hypothetical protein